MARLVSIHEIELIDGADAVEFERLVAEGAPQLPVGWKSRLLRGDRGERAGKYAILYEIDSPEARDRYFPRMVSGRRILAATRRSIRPRPRSGSGCEAW